MFARVGLAVAAFACGARNKISPVVVFKRKPVSLGFYSARCVDQQNQVEVCQTCPIFILCAVREKR